LQIFSNVGYILLVDSGLNRPLMYNAMAFESLTQGMGTGAFAVLLLRLTQKRFSATQYALFSSLFGLPRLLAGPVSGFLVDALGWKIFFWSTMAAGVPGMLLLHRFAPLGMREPPFTVEPATALPPLSTAALVWRGLLGTVAGVLIGAGLVATLAGLRGMKSAPGGEFLFMEPLRQVIRPGDIGGWLQLSGIMIFGIVIGLVAATLAAARHGALDDPTHEDQE
jgi:PAT family beta-lactamase induction signal transducer AmpG